LLELLWRPEESETMTAHALYVTAAYGVSALAIAVLIAWVLADGRARRREMAELEASGLRRRSDRKDVA
jgi:heme exporter protein D